MTEPRRILVTGDRNWTDRELIGQWLVYEVNVVGHGVLIEGEARGADRLSAEVARELGFEVLRFPADWDRYHRAAGPIRNQQMLDEGSPDIVLAFHDDLEHSRGTADMVRRARKAGLQVRHVSHAGWRWVP